MSSKGANKAKKPSQKGKKDRGSGARPAQASNKRKRESPPAKAANKGGFHSKKNFGGGGKRDEDDTPFEEVRVEDDGTQPFVSPCPPRLFLSCRSCVLF